MLLMWAVFKVFIESVMVLLLFYALVCWPQSIQTLVPPPGMEPTLPVSEGEVLTPGPTGSPSLHFKPSWFCCRFLEAHVSQTASPPKAVPQDAPQGWLVGHLGEDTAQVTQTHALCGCVYKHDKFQGLFSMTDDGESASTKQQKRGWKSQSSGKHFVPTDVAHCQGLETCLYCWTNMGR